MKLCKTYFNSLESNITNRVTNFNKIFWQKNICDFVVGTGLPRTRQCRRRYIGKRQDHTGSSIQNFLFDHFAPRRGSRGHRKAQSRSLSLSYAANTTSSGCVTLSAGTQTLMSTSVLSYTHQCKQLSCHPIARKFPRRSWMGWNTLPTTDLFPAIFHGTRPPANSGGAFS